MANFTKYKCPFCDKVYVTENDSIEPKERLYDHMEEDHEEQLNGLPPAQVYFNSKNNYKTDKVHGKCIVCDRPTQFNLETERYNRLCGRERCKDEYREMFKRRMMKKYGKVHLLDDPEQQKKMLENRKISGTYKWRDGKHEFTYTGSYEKDFLEFLDKVMRWDDPEDIMAPAPQVIKYDHPEDDDDHFYLPDFYITSVDLIVEIKAGDNSHYRNRDLDIEKAKDRAMERSEFNYIKLMDKKYGKFFNYLLELKKK